MDDFAGINVAKAFGLTAFVVVASYMFLSGDDEDNTQIEPVGAQVRSQARNQVVKRMQDPSLVGYVGLPNIGNTCYLNSLLQALSGCSSYVNYAESIYNQGLLGEYQDDPDTEDQRSNQILFQFIYLLLQLNYKEQDVDPSQLYRLICQDGEFTKMNEEQDAHEFNLFLQDKLSETVPKRVRLKMNGINPDEDQSKSTSVSLSQQESLSKSQKTTLKLAANPLQSIHTASIECQVCSEKGCPPITRTEYNLDMFLTIPSDANTSIPLEQLIYQQFRPESIDGYNCTKCSIREFLSQFMPNPNETRLLLTTNQINWNLPTNLDPEELNQLIQAINFFHRMYRVPDLNDDDLEKQKKSDLRGNIFAQSPQKVQVSVTKQRLLLRTPKLLCMHLNRMSYDNQGNFFINKRQVNFPEILNLDPAVLETQQSFTYKLSGLIEHIGTPRCGHYIAAKRLNEDQFLLCNDSQVRPIDTSQVLEAKAYMLFYELC